MKLLVTILLLFYGAGSFAQLEISSGVAINKIDALGPIIHFAYDFKIKNKLYTKSQLGYKYLHIYNDYVGATLNVSTIELHQTLSYEIIRKKNYILKPNVGINYRWYRWTGKMKPPYSTLPQRAWVIGVRDKNFVLNSYDENYSNQYHANNLGFSIQVQNQFRYSDKLWFHITPFVEPDYDRSQNIGGAYVGVVLYLR
jgi:hypothetical protein